MQISKLPVFDVYRLYSHITNNRGVVTLTLQNTDKEANFPLSSNVQTLKCCQLQVGFASLIPLTRGSAPEPRWRLCPQTPLYRQNSDVDGTCSTIPNCRNSNVRFTTSHGRPADVCEVVKTAELQQFNGRYATSHRRPRQTSPGRK